MMLNFSGERGPCFKHVCLYGSICVIKAGYAVCECPACSEEFEPVCGTDGISYTNLCRLKQEGCQRKADIEIAYHGLCSEYLMLFISFKVLFSNYKSQYQLNNEKAKKITRSIVTVYIIHSKYFYTRKGSQEINC